MRGQFPDAADDGLISLGWLQAALSRKAIEPGTWPRSLGVGVARFGSDFTALYVVEGARILHAEAQTGQDPMRTTGRVLALAREHGPCAKNVAIDHTGVGGGVTDRLHEQRFMARG